MKRISSQAIQFTKVLPSILVEQDCVTIHGLLLTRTLNERDVILNAGEVLDLLNSRAPLDVNNLEQNSFLNHDQAIYGGSGKVFLYRDFPGVKADWLDNTGSYIRFMSSKTLPFSSPQYYPMRQLSLGISESGYPNNMVLRNEIVNSYDAIPQVILKVPYFKNNNNFITDFTQTNITIIYGLGGYWCNLDGFTEMQPTDFISSGSLNRNIKDPNILKLFGVS
jgi:hypothetical protein